MADLTKSLTYNGLDVNSVTRVGGGAPMSGYLTDKFDPSHVDVVAYRSKRAQKDGEDASDIYLGARMPFLIVTAYGSTRGDLWDKEQALLAAFSPTLAYAADTANLGFLPLAFYQPTANITSWPTSAYPDGIPLQYYARPIAGTPPHSYDRDTDGGNDGKGGSKQFRIQLLCRDPRKYAQTATSQSITTSTTTATNLGNYPTPPVITIVSASTTGSMGLTIAGVSFSATIDFASTTYVIDCGTGTILKNGVLRMNLLDTGVVWPVLLSAGANAISRTAVTGATVTMSFRHAFA